MDVSEPARHPVLHYLAVVRAARDFGIEPHELDPLARRFPPASGAAEELAEFVADALLERR